MEWGEKKRKFNKNIVKIFDGVLTETYSVMILRAVTFLVCIETRCAATNRSRANTCEQKRQYCIDNVI